MINKLAKFTVLVFLTLLSPSRALEDYYELENGKTFQTCAYVANYDGSKIFSYSEGLIPSISVKAPNGLPDGATLDTLIISAEDLNSVKLDPAPMVKVCDESAINKLMCTYPNYNEVEDTRISLNQLIEEELFQKSLEHIALNNNELSKNEDDAHHFRVYKTSIYCIVFTLSGLKDDLDASGNKINKKISVVVDWQQSFGRLLVSDYHYLYLDLLMALLYLGLSVCYSYYLYSKLRADKSNAILMHSIKYRTYGIQFKILTYVVGSFLNYLATAFYYMQLNRVGYVHNSIVISLIYLLSLSLGTAFTIWAVYNFMLMSTGILFFGNFNQFKKINFIKIISIVLLVEFLIFDIEESTVYDILSSKPTTFLGNFIYLQLILVFTLCCYWTYQLFKQLKNKSIRLRLMVTLVLIVFAFLFEFVSRVKVLKDYLHDKLLAVVNATSYSYLLNFIATLFVAFIWKDSYFDNVELAIKS